MKAFEVFESAYKKATSNGRQPRGAMKYALMKYVNQVTEDLVCDADSETRERFVDAGFDVYTDKRLADETHGDAARAATKHISHLLKKAYAKATRVPAGDKKAAKPSEPSREPLHDFKDMGDSLPKAGRRPSSFQAHASPYTGGKPEYRGNDAANYANPGSHSYSYEFHEQWSTPFGSGSNHFSAMPNPQGNSQWPPMPPMPAGVGRYKLPDPIFNMADNFGSSSFPNPNLRTPAGTGQFTPAGTGRFSLPEPRFTNDRGSFPNAHRPFPANDSVPTKHAGASNRKSRSSEAKYKTQEFKPSKRASDMPRPSPPPPSAGTKPATCFYTVLNVPRTVTPEEIRGAYRKLSLKYHPDRAADADRAEATQKMAEINQANDILGDPEKRRFYDKTGCVRVNR